MLRKIHLMAATAALLSLNIQALEEFVMPRMQQNTYLSHAKPAEQFGLRTVEGEKGLTYIGSAKVPQNQKVTIAFESGPIPLIRVSKLKKNSTMNVLLDTGSPISWMEFGTALDFKAAFLGTSKKQMPYPGPLNTGGASGFAAVLPRIDMGYVEIYNTPIYIRMALHSLGPFARGISAPHVDSVFGYDFIKNFEYVRFDFQKREVLFSTTEPYKPHADLLMSTAAIKTVAEKGLAVEGSIHGVATPVILDVAGDYHFSRGDVKVNVTKQVSLGDVVWRQLPTLLLPTGTNRAPRAGRKMLELYTITVCPKKGVVYFERLPE